MNSVLHLRDLEINRGYQKILHGLNVDYAPGDVIHIQGPNGSGKTTLLMTIAGLLKPREGAITYKGDKLSGSDFYFIGTLPSMKAPLTVKQNLEIWASLEGKSFKSQSHPLSKLDINPHLDKQFKTLSKGQQQRVSLSRLFIKEKPIWLLDEPFSNLDAHGVDLFLSETKKHSQTGGIVIFTSHHPIKLPDISRIDLELLRKNSKEAS